MKITHKQNLATVAFAFACTLVWSTAQAQNHPTFDGSFTLAPADADTSGGGGAADGNAAQDAELAKKLQNPVAALISVPIQNNWDFGIGPANRVKYTANIQPVVPIS